MAYPTSIDELTDGVPSDGAAPTTALDNATFPHDDHHRALATAVEAVETELGTTAAGNFTRTGAAYYPPMVAGLFYAAPTRGDDATLTPTLNRLYFLRLPRPGGLSIVDIGVETAVAAAATGTMRVGAYTEVAGVPSVLISDFGSTATDVGGTTFVHKAGTVAAGTSPIWLAVVFQTTVTSLVVRASTSASGWGADSGVPAARNQAGYIQASVTAGLPNPAVVSGKSANQMPIIVATPA